MSASPQNLAAIALLSTMVLGANAAQVQLSQSALHGGGGRSVSSRYAAETALTGFAGSSASAGGSIVLHEGHTIPQAPPPFPQRSFAVLPETGPLTTPFSGLPGLEAPGLTVTLLSSNTPANGSARLERGAIVYAPPTGNPPRTDSVAYLVTDSFGHTSAGTLVVQHPSALPSLVSFRRAGSELNLRFKALADSAYLLQRRAAFGANEAWLDYPSAVEPFRSVSDADGAVSFTIEIPEQPGSHAAFFRLADESSLRHEVGIRRSGSVLLFQLRGLPNSLHKLQTRSSVGPETSWTDYPAGHPFTSHASRDGFYSFSIPVAERTAFFRATPVEWD